VVGGMVGQGILRTPGIIAGAVHSPELILALWAMGALLAGISAFAYVELATAIPCAGGPYDFVRRAFGPLAGVVTGWGAWLILITLESFLGIVVAEFLHRLGVFTDVPPSVVAIGVLAIFWAVNLTSTRIAGDSQILLSAFKGAALIALIILLFSHPSTGTSASLGDVATPVGIAAFAIAMRNVMNTYNGWDEVVYFGEEIKSPQRTLPRAIAIGIAGVAILYLLINLALLHVLSPAQMAGSKLVAADAMKIVLGPSGELATTIFAVLSVAAITNLAMMKSARISFALARSGDLPSKLGIISSTGIPRWALSVSSLLAMIFAATGTYETVVAMNVAVGLVIVIAVNLAVMRLRRTEPDLDRPFRMPWFPLPALLAIALNAALLIALIYEDPIHSLAGLVALVVIGGVYLVVGRKQRTEAA
jgi:APA family basic amino acid/polyamine antiporter